MEAKKGKSCENLLAAEAAATAQLDYDSGDGGDGEEIPSAAAKPSSSNVSGPKSCCRLCGASACDAGTFLTNFEIFGMIQKCFPTLNIQQDDNLPKDMCSSCLRRLNSFSEFLDKVLETQCELQQKCRVEKPAKPLEHRPLKIKQEPVVKVKQEVAEGLDSFLSDDLDVGIDDCCEPESDAVSVDQKFGFCDFPALNAQDIINNCDIMEIINLDDAFINIADDDTATIIATEPIGKAHTPSAHQLLQTHMLIDEHNYACPVEELKEEWQIKMCCKTEDTETDLFGQFEVAEAGCDEDYQNSMQVEQTESTYVCPSQVEVMDDFAETERSAKPIVTSVSAIAESRLNLNCGNLDSANISNANTSVSDLPPRINLSKSTNAANNKPNIVVLNESIVKSTEAFQLHACVLCQLKFFSIESLRQHVKCIHEPVASIARSDVPPISLPVGDLSCTEYSLFTENKENTNTTQNSTQTSTGPENHDNRKQLLNFQNSMQGENSIISNEQSSNFPSWQHNMKTLHLNAMIDTWIHGSAYQTQDSMEICTLPEPTTTQTNALCAPEASSSAADVSTQIKEIPSATNSKAIMSTMASHDMNRIMEAIMPKPKAANTSDSVPPLSQMAVFNTSQQDTDYKYLQRRYRVLLRKCKALKEKYHVLARNTKRKNHICPHCPIRFSSIYQLIQHKQRLHRAQKLHSSFSACCFGCEKYFMSKRALINHIKYICQSVSLRLFKTRLRVFKCRWCRNISFTHWRLFRNHETRCKQQVDSKQRRKLQQCTTCKRDFANELALTLHMTAEHRATWQLRCEQCGSKFRRLSAILQHYSKGGCKLQTATGWDCAMQCCNCQKSFRFISKLLEHNQCQMGSSNAVSAAATVVKKQQEQLQPKEAQFPCSICEKVFTSRNKLSQHRITHTQEKRHKCGLCARAFKRRGGLTQHMKGFHLELKPYECPVCKYHYALKGDMLRCRHSMRKRMISRKQ